LCIFLSSPRTISVLALLSGMAEQDY
jgi:hypothetical protein